MREYGKVSPAFWTDSNGINHKVPQIKGRLKPGKIPLHAALKKHVIDRDGRKCKVCGRGEVDGVVLVADHIVSKRNGGSHHPDNMQCLCDSCNATKANLVDRGGRDGQIQKG